MSASASSEPTYFSSAALDRACAGMAAGVISTMCMNPLDLVKTRFQVNQVPFSAEPADRSRLYQGIARRPWLFYMMGGKPVVDIVDAVRGIAAQDGLAGLYRGVMPNIVGNASSWGLYFLWYTMIKDYMAQHHSRGASQPLTASEHLLAASTSGVITAVMTNPLWVIKTRMFTSSALQPTVRPSAAGTHSATSEPGRAGLATSKTNAPIVYRNMWHGFVSTWQTEGIVGLYRGVGLAIIGVSNGAIQFMAYEQLKQWRSSAYLRRTSSDARFSEQQLDNVKLPNVEYTLISGAAKLFAILLTYPYQVIRSRVQSLATSHLYRSTWDCARITFRDEGLRGMYRGLATNIVRILPGTCVTFVAYENVSWMLRTAAARRSSTSTSEQHTV